MRRGQRAQAALEFALVMPILMLIILGVLDTGRAVVAAASLNNAAAEGARYVAMHAYDGSCSSLNCQSEAETIVGNAAVGVMTADIGIIVSVAPSNIVTVGLSYPFHSITPVISSTLGIITLTANSTMLAR